VAAPDLDFHYDVDSILERANPHTRIVLIANPDNPSGPCLSGSEVRRLHAGLAPETLLIVDAAYEEFADIEDYESGTRLVHEFDNVIVTRTFSKVYGLAGLRLGWCYGPAWVADLLTKIGPSFPINVVAQEAGLASVLDNDHMQAVLKHTTMWITKFSEALRGMGLIVYPSQTNFVLVRFPPECGKTSAEVNTYLNENGIIPRQFAVDAFGDKLRFTIGRDDEMEKTIQVLGEFLT
ncbi:MAG: aminotransferase class I/II-fold pyridoxal phosphate-dependent enzyme, partial [Rhodospirillales bacterium]|nr:aminotransferase class I/II-fold pyridoxal phosphate-dependent enzyme [Rhodospirillales bacterium]